MPEGDSLERAALQLRPVLAGQRLTGAQLRVPRLAALNLTGRTIDSVEAYGKHLFFGIGDHTLASHLRMEGRWMVIGPQARWPAPGHQVRAVLQTAGHQVLGVQLGELDWLDRASRAQLMSRLGPDPLHDWHPEQVLATLRTTPERPIGLALLDQSVLAGVGTIHRSEALFAVQLHPMVPIGQLSDAQLLELLEAARASLAGGAELPDDRPLRRPGRRPAQVYGREHRPCPRCGTPIIRQELSQPTRPGQRLTTHRDEFSRTWFGCPQCQPCPR